MQSEYYSNSVTNILKTIISGAKDVIVGIWNALKEWIVGIFYWIVESQLQRNSHSLNDSISDKMNAAKDKIKSIWDQCNVLLQGS